MFFSVAVTAVVTATVVVAALTKQMIHYLVLSILVVLLLFALLADSGAPSTAESFFTSVLRYRLTQCTVSWWPRQGLPILDPPPVSDTVGHHRRLAALNIRTFG